MRGIVVGQQGIDTALVRLASEAEAAALFSQPQRAVQIEAAVESQPSPYMIVGMDLHVSVGGTFVRVGVCTNVFVDRPMFDVTAFGDATPQFIGGLARLRGEFEGRV